MGVKRRGYKGRHFGQTCIIMGNGPSLNKVPKEFLDKHITFGSNKIYALPYQPDYYCIVDDAMLENCLPKLQEGWRPKRQMFLRAEACLEDNYPIYPVVLNAFSKDINNFVVMGGTVTFVMFQLAIYMGFTEILLVGIDHYYPKTMIGKPELFVAEGDDPDHFVCEGGEPYFRPGEKYARPEDTTGAYVAAKEFFDEFGMKCINLTEGTKLDVFEKGKIKDYVKKKNDTMITTTSVDGIDIIGRFSVSSKGFTDLFKKYVEGVEDYIEIGTLFGGSACLAGRLCKGIVHCIDPLDGYYGEGKPDFTGHTPSIQTVRENWGKFGLSPNRLKIFKQKHPPFPSKLEGKRFDVAYIDGDHSYEGAKADWLALKDRVNKYIIFDDTNKETVGRVFTEAQQSRDWEFVEEIGGSIRTGVLRKVKRGEI